jgi:hypothetical protein
MKATTFEVIACNITLPSLPSWQCLSTLHLPLLAMSGLQQPTTRNMLIYDDFLMTFSENVKTCTICDDHNIFITDQHHSILGPYFHDVFSDSSQTGPLHCDVLSHLSQMNKPFVMFCKIHHGWKTNSLVNMDPPIVFSLRGMNISCWSYMSDLHQKNFCLDYRNIILCQLGGLYDTLVLGFEPMTPWSSEAFTTRLLLQLCCCASYCFFVLWSKVLIRSSQHENGSQTRHLSDPTAQKCFRSIC